MCGQGASHRRFGRADESTSNGGGCMKSLLMMITAAAVVACGAGQARADVLMPPPPSCPEGSVGEECHGPGRCRPLSCAGHDDCAPGMICQAASLCIRQVNCSGRAMIYVDSVEGSCAGGAACDDGVECHTQTICVPGDRPPPDDADVGADGAADADGGFEVARWGCDCRVGGRSPGVGAFGLGMLAVICVLLFRRRR